jgi:hypothetical protein
VEGIWKEEGERESDDEEVGEAEDLHKGSLRSDETESGEYVRGRKKLRS